MGSEMCIRDRSRVGLNPISIPEGVTVNVSGSVVNVKGPKGELNQHFDSDFKIKIEDNVLKVSRPSEQKRHKSLHGLYRSLINNAVNGVSEGYEKKLKLIGVGYRASIQGKKVNLTLGFSHPVVYKIPDEIEIETPSRTEITIRGIDKQKVGQVAAEIRSLRPPEPYKGKGVRYQDEQISLKETKKTV